MKHKSRLALPFAALTLLGAAQPDRETKPGEGVLCLGTFIYFVEKTGAMCRPGQDKEFQERIAGYTDRIDAYFIRNTDGNPATLEKFKDGQNLNSEDRDYICEGDVARSYDEFLKIEAAKMDAAVDKMLERDGPPTFGDCL
jgi:hypothetical protein